MDWAQLYKSTDDLVSLNIIFNKAYITSLVSFASLAGTFYLLRLEKSESEENISCINMSLP